MTLGDRVASIIVEVAEAEILPRFRRLAPEDVREKGPGDLVTEADLAAERQLEARLADILPGSLVIGEEACAQDPSILGRLGGLTLWIIDPVDGTHNFVRGRNEFGVMVTLVQAEVATHAWIYRPTERQMLVAEKGAGAIQDGKMLHGGSSPAAPSLWSLAIHAKSFPGELRKTVEKALPQFARTGSSYCAAVEYQAIAGGLSDGAAYWRLMPWDHAAGTLIVTEAGGLAAHIDGTDYRPTREREGLLVVRDPLIWQDLCMRIFDTGRRTDAPLA